CPERVFFLTAQLAVGAGSRVAGPAVARVTVRPGGPDQCLPGGGEFLAGSGLAGCGQQRPGVVMGSGGTAGQDWQDREPLTGAGVHPGLATTGELASLQVFWPDGARGHPRTPPGRVVQRPLGQVEVEGPDA